MDGIEELNGVTVLAATNKPQVIVSLCLVLLMCNNIAKDPALMRPGRLDRIMSVHCSYNDILDWHSFRYVGPPEQEARKQLFALRLAKMTVEEGIDLDELSKMVSIC